MKERGQKSFTEVLREVPRSVPALMRACKLMEKAARAGVCPADDGELEQIRADLARSAAGIGGEEGERALGDALLMLCALARRYKIDAEIALNEAADRFIERFAALERELTDGEITLPAPPEDGQKYWNRVKL